MAAISARNDRLGQSDLDVDDQYIANVTTRAYRRLCDRWKLNDDMAARLALMDVQTWDLIKLGRWVGTLREDQVVRIGLLFQLYESLHIVFEEQIANRWITMANEGPLCKGGSPLEVMLTDGIPAMVAFRNYMSKLAR